MVFFYTVIGVSVFMYPLNKLVRYILSKGNIPAISKAWLTFIIIFMFMTINLSLWLHNGQTIIERMINALPSLVFFLIIDLFRKNEDSAFFKFTRNRLFRWLLAFFSFIFLIPVFKSFILSTTGFNDIYYIISLFVTIGYMYVLLRKQKSKVVDEVDLST